MTAESDQVLSLFSGAGGFSYGFGRAGLKPRYGVEIDSDACATYEANVGSPCHNLDLSAVAPGKLKKEFGPRPPLAIIGGPPCQGFSTAGARDHSDPRNRLIFNYLGIVGELQPRWFVFENVEGLLTSGQGEAVEALVREFLGLGYTVRVQKVNFAAYGVPQTRKRVLIVGNRMGLDFDLPGETHSYDSGKSKKQNGLPPAPTIDEALAGLGPAAPSRAHRVDYAKRTPVNDYDALMRQGNLRSRVSLHYQKVSLLDEARLSVLKPGQTMKDLPQEHWHESYRRRAFRRVSDGMPTEKRGGAPSGIKRLFGDKQSLTITGAATREFIHPHEHRPLTLRECARIQTFPDGYDFRGGVAAIAQQIGNAVPPMAAERIAHHILQVEGTLGSDRNVAKHLLRPPRLLGFLLTEATGMSPALRATERRLNGFMGMEFA